MNPEALIQEYVDQDYIKNLIKSKKPWLEVLQDMMKTGKEVTDAIGHVNYASLDDFFQDIEAGTSPIVKLDNRYKPLGRIGNTMWLGVSECPVKALTLKMLNNGIDEIYISNVEQLEDEMMNSMTLGSYILLQIRQQVVSSLKIKGKYVANITNLLHQTATLENDKIELEFIVADGTVKNIVENSNLTGKEVKEKINELLIENNNDLCIYAVYVDVDELGDD